MTFWRHHVDESVAAPAREFAHSRVRPVADELEQADVYPADLVAKTAEAGWNSMTLPKHYGGSAAPMEHALAVFEELGAGSASLGVSLISIFQSSKIIELYGPRSLAERILPRYAKGLRASYALTEGGRGSDIRSLETKARKSGSGWVVKGEKAFITSGSRADFFVVLAETDVGVSTFAVERDTPGVSTRETREAETFGLRNGPHVNLVLDDVELPEDALIGVEGKGLKQAMVTLSNSRTLAAGISLGIARAAFDEAFAYVSERSAFGGKVIDFQGIQWYFAEAVAEIDAARLLCYQAARDLDTGGDYQRSSSAAKLVAATLATKVSAMAVQVCGAHGTQETASFGRYLRDAKAYEVAGGSSEILKNTIAKSLIKTAQSG
ncbi:acyl-CoA dehydrogenase family protein [Streptomyces malaysiensis]|uniref:acyl-CoA dehydrogenase family protein n=1 Tax=Streptomyces malaysiensis TaxID=92644 RepID=UPI002B28B4DD|nr:acyl-CoA dehydrogenase family protein [Streptomyces malaysiensis]